MKYLICNSYYIQLILFALFSFGLTNNSYGLKERDYQQEFCKGRQDVLLIDKTRVDCLTENYAIEFDWAYKYAEALGQSLHYALVTNKQPGITLIYKKPSDVIYQKRLKAIIDNYNLSVFLCVINTKNQIKCNI